MRQLAFSVPLLVISFFLILPHAAGALDDNLYFSVSPESSYSCIEVNLPQDLGKDITSAIDSYIELDKAKNPWADVTYNKVGLRPGMQTKSPVCFYHPGAKEGDFSFYSIELTSQELGVSREINGGFCLSSTEDADTLPETSNICDAMSQNTDIFDVQFKFDSMSAKPGEKITQTFFVTSYANLRIRVHADTEISNDLGTETIDTSPSNPLATRSFSVRVPDQEGTYNLKLIAEVEGCSLSFCRKEIETTINAAESFVQTGFMASVIPKNINIKNAQKTYFRVIIKNFDATKEFTVDASSSKPATMEPKTISTDVDNIDEKTLTFTVTPQSDEKTLYTLNFRISTGQTERILTSYLTVGELLSDAIQYADNAKKTAETPAARDQINSALNGFSASYNSTVYGEELPDLEQFKEKINNAINTPSGQNGTTTNHTGKNEEEGFDWTLIIIPIIIAVAVILFVLYKKTKVVDELGEYSELRI